MHVPFLPHPIRIPAGTDPRGATTFVARDDAPPCTRSGVDTSAWRLVSTRAVPSRGLGAFALRLPPDYGAGHLSARLAASPDGSQSALVGDWGAGDRTIAVWAGAESRYATVGRAADWAPAPGDARECHLDLALGRIQVVSFALVGPGAQREHVVSAYWPAGGGQWLRALASGPDRASQEEFVTILSTLAPATGDE